MASIDRKSTQRDFEHGEFTVVNTWEISFLKAVDNVADLIGGTQMIRLASEEIGAGLDRSTRLEI